VEIFESKTEGVSDSLVFAFETPGGFWLVLFAVFIAQSRPPSPDSFSYPPLYPPLFESTVDVSVFSCQPM
jgi:hypothetical protein